MGLPQVSPAGIRFGVFEADVRAGELRKSGVKVRIQQLPFRALTVLLSRPGEVVSREDLRQALWPEDVFVDFDQGISSAIRRLRDALGDTADNPVFIETVERRGYRWIAPIHPLEPPSQEKVLVAAPVPAKFSPWRKLLFALPVLALVFAVWIFRPSYRSARAGAKYGSASASGIHHAANREAEEYYLKGRFYWNKRTPESLNQAVDSFTQAIVQDSNYSDAYVGLADCYNLLREYTLMPASEAYPRALAAAKKAVELDDHSSEAHASLAFVSFFGMWDAATADREFRRAVALDPNNANAHHWYATYLLTLGRFDESLKQIDRAQALDPDSASILADKGMLLWRAGHRKEALRLLRQLEQADPDSVSPHRYLKLAYLEMGEYPAYLSEMKKEALLLHDASLSAIEEAAERGFAARGERGMFDGLIEQQERAYAQGKLSPFFLAQTYSREGNTQEALKYLEACYDRHSEEILNIDSDGTLNNLHPIPAFQQLLAKVGLPPIS
ncbi:MAG: winged helix-turn-helix domain-containing protein [Acidobacteriia bacterium]|nr:winged helix-turn-helix domain-containing protein [Terriglobia bacterium]